MSLTEIPKNDKKPTDTQVFNEYLPQIYFYILRTPITSIEDILGGGFTYFFIFTLTWGNDPV